MHAIKAIGASMPLLWAAVSAGPAAAADWRIFTWGVNLPEWNQKPGVTAARLGCTESPEKCVGRIDSAETQGIDTVFPAISSDRTPADNSSPFRQEVRAHWIRTCR